MIRQQKKILGRLFEGLGIGLISGTIVTFSLTGIKYWYFLIAGLLIALFGTYWYENNYKE